MLCHFPVAHPDELLGSVLARFIARQGLTDDKVALEQLFGSRLIVPSALWQGHIHQLLQQVGHVWLVNTRQVQEAHTLLPLFRPFVGRRNYERLAGDMSGKRQNHCQLRAGVNASILQWPTRYQICPLCWHEQLRQYGYSYWQRLFQCPGVESCPQHGCLLLDTELAIQSEHRHHFVGTQDMRRPVPHASATASGLQIKLARLVQELLSPQPGMPDIGLLETWSRYYHRLAAEQGYTYGKKVRHQQLSNMVTSYWGNDWLENHGLGLESENNWLTMMFRKHRRPFSYLQHVVCWCALVPEIISVKQVFTELVALPHVFGTCAKYHSNRAASRCYEYRAAWIQQLSLFSCLTEMRANKEGARLYSWLFRFDHEWLKAHLPAKLVDHRAPRVDWHARDLILVRQLLKIERQNILHLEGPRRSAAWYLRQIQAKNIKGKKLSFLPLCRDFLVRYAESVDEYQTRRLARVTVDIVRAGMQKVGTYEIERRAGLSKERILEPARKILRMDIETRQGSAVFSQGGTITPG